MKPRFTLPLIALTFSALLLAGLPTVSAQVAGKGGARAASGSPRTVQHPPQHHRHQHRAPRVSIGVGIGFGGFYDPFFDPYYPYGYPPYGGYASVLQPPVPCTPADVPKSEPTTNPFSPDYAYDRIDASRCSPQAIADATAAAQAQSQAPVPSTDLQQSGAFYFCRSANAYYPYVSTCTEGWQRVAPRPPGN